MSWLSHLAVLVARNAERAAADDAERALAVKAARAAVKKPLAVKALPAPPKRLALPAPGPGLPAHAAKPRGGQWWVDREINGANFSPEHAVRKNTPIGLQMSSGPSDVALREWYHKALPRYLKTDFASPTDPLRDLAERGLLHIPGASADDWSKIARESFIEDPIQDVLFARNRRGGMPGAGDDLRGEAMAAMPWLAKQPVTDNVYGMSQTSLGGLDLTHLVDEMRNAMSHEANGIPADLAVRPDMLQRMSFPQAVERVGRINQFRAKQMEEAALGHLNSPAVHTFKEYPENNPMGLRWTELRAPETKPMPEWGWEDLGGGRYRAQDGNVFQADQNRPGGFSAEGDYWHLPDTHNPRAALQDALKYEGDTMGHCVGGYCDDVLSGRSRIFSLRDAKGEPHVTIETQPLSKNTAAADHLRNLGVLADWQNYWNNYPRATPNNPEEIHGVTQQFLEARGLPPVDYSGQNIIQIKGKQNRAPKDDYLPFVQDFVKGGQWGDVGDLKNTGLVKLPDGRYIRHDQFDEGSNSLIRSTYPDLTEDEYANFAPDLRPKAYNLKDWSDDWARHFEGYAFGGRVEASRDFCHNPLTVRGPRASMRVK